jgi:hypothetical protein
VAGSDRAYIGVVSPWVGGHFSLGKLIFVPANMAVEEIVQHSPVDEKAADAGPHASEVDSEKAEGEHKQDGVKHVEAITSAWTKKALWITFVL